MADQAPAIPNLRVPQFTTGYANNVQFESTTLDLTLVFGRYDGSVTPPQIQQHSAITMTWAEAKLAMYFLQVNLAIHESEHGTITIPKRLIPEAFTLSPEQAETPTGKQALERTAKILEAFIASL